MQLRHFLYRDDELVREFLAQIEGGVYDKSEQVTRDSGGSGIGGGVSAGPVAGRADRSKESSREESRTVRQTGASEFQRLYAALGDDLQYLEIADEGVWVQLRRGEPLEVEAIIRPSGFDKLAGLTEAFEGLLPIMQAMGVEEEVDDKTAAAIAGIRALAGSSSDRQTIIARLAGAPEFRFACSLKTASLLVSSEELEGEATIVGKIQRKLREGETYLLPSVFAGLESMIPEADQDDLLRIFEDDMAKQLGLASPKLEYPAAILTPIAVYR